MPPTVCYETNGLRRCSLFQNDALAPLHASAIALPNLFSISGTRRADVTRSGAREPPCRGIGIAKIRRKPQSQRQQGRHPVDIAGNCAMALLRTIWDALAAVGRCLMHPTCWPGALWWCGHVIWVCRVATHALPGIPPAAARLACICQSAPPGRAATRRSGRCRVRSSGKNSPFPDSAKARNIAADSRRNGRQ